MSDIIIGFVICDADRQSTSSLVPSCVAECRSPSVTVIDLTVPPPPPVAADMLQSYSSKMMKAIWGQYNRYSVHNFKSNQALPLVLAAQPEPLARAEQAADNASAAAGLLTSQ